MENVSFGNGFGLKLDMHSHSGARRGSYDKNLPREDTAVHVVERADDQLQAGQRPLRQHCKEEKIHIDRILWQDPLAGLQDPLARLRRTLSVPGVPFAESREPLEGLIIF